MDFFNDEVSVGFVGSIALSCEAPVIVVYVGQDLANGGFPTDRITIKGAK